MNRQIVQLFGLSMLLFAVLVGFTSYWSVLEADELKDETANRRPLIEEQQIPRGLITAADGTVLARSVPRGTGERRIFTRTYPTGPLFAHAVGYSFIEKGRVGLERERNDVLTGEENEFASIFSQLESRDREGEDVTTTLDPAGSARHWPASGPSRVGGGIRAPNGPCAGHGERARVRPQPDSRPLRGVQPRRELAAG